MRAAMSLIDLLRAPWAIMPDRLDEIQTVYATHFRGEKIDIEAIEARLGKKLANEPPMYEMRAGGVAVLAISGVLAPKANLFTQVSGGASVQQLVQQIEAMGDSTAVRGAVLAWDSPGGSVQGIPTLARAVRQLADRKPVVSVCDGTMCSAAYWAGSGANAIYASGETDALGSIGVVATHTYDPRSTTRQVTEIVAGRYKRIASDSRPLSAEGEAYLQAQVDEIYAVFVQTVADARGVSVEEVLAHMADGRVFVGRQALAAGLIEGFATTEQIVEQMAAEPQRFAQRQRAVIAAVSAASASSQQVPNAAAPGVALAASQPHPEAQPVAPVSCAAAESTPGDDSMSEQITAEMAAKLRAEGAAQERERIAAVRAQSMPGHEALIEQLAADGKTTGPEAAMAVLAAERSARAAQAAARAADAPRPLKLDPAPEDTRHAAAKLGRPGRMHAGVDAAELDRQAQAYMAEHPGVTYLAAVKAVQAAAAVA